MNAKMIIENGSFKKIPALARPHGKQFVIITDAHMKVLGEKLLHAMRQAELKCHLLLIPAGEKSKSLEFTAKMASSLVKLGLKRDGCLIGLGGGVVGDSVGFLASIYMRGVAFISIPTTLLAMGDSSIGGKTGVDLPEGKNLLGTFYHPKIIIMDPLLLLTLPERDFKSGLAEVIKHGIIADKTFFNFLKKNAGKILNRDKLMLKQVVAKSAAIKLKIVRRDERESLTKARNPVSRMLLNYGHTVGHALEQLSDYTLPHGEAVAIGMVAENRVAVGRKILKQQDAQTIIEVLKMFGLPTKIPSKYAPAQIKKGLGMDKKHIGGKLHFALPIKIGWAKVVTL